MKKIYTKPACQFVNIQLNDLCVGSKNATIPVHFQAIKKERKRFTYSFDEGKTDGMWRTEL